VDVATALDRLPKVELHCHVEGTMRPGTVVELATRNGWTPMSVSLVTALGASFVWSVLKTRCPVRDA